MSLPTSSLTERFAEVLPKDTAFHFYHVSTPPTRCPPIFAPPPGAKPERTYCESHLLNASITCESGDSKEELFVLGIEIFIYSTKHLTTLFVSKADSTGYLSKLVSSRTQPSPLKTITSTFIEYLVESRQRPNRRLLVSLFAIAQGQYLFPGSIENASKHVLDDRGLVKWWCRILDPVLRRHAHEEAVSEFSTKDDGSGDKTTAQGYLIVPGFDQHDTARFFPLTAQLDPPSHKRWKNGHPLQQISTTPSAPPRSLIPHFPDDPKARFLDELDDELPDGNSQFTSTPTRNKGQWRSVKTLEQFWEMMSFRQECSSGRLVGFIWVVFTPPEMLHRSQEDGVPQEDGVDSQFFATPSSPLPAAASREHRSPSKRRKLSGPIIPRLPRIKSGTSNPPTDSIPGNSEYFIWPSAGRGEIVLDAKNYKRAHDLLLRLDFANAAVAASSTRRWIDEVAVIADHSDGWGKVVVGRKTVAQPSIAVSDSTNTLHASSIRKKRKADASSDSQQNGDGAPSILDAGLIKKKSKIKDDASRTIEAPQSATNSLESDPQQHDATTNAKTPLEAMAPLFNAMDPDLLHGSRKNRSNLKNGFGAL